VDHSYSCRHHRGRLGDRVESAEGFTRFWPSAWTIAAMTISVYLLAIAARSIPIGTAYAVWGGIGAAGTVVLGMVLLDEPREVARLVCLGLIIAGVVGLKLVEHA
jgi:quaternary ammonium compound-resistance protein SugE